MRIVPTHWFQKWGPTQWIYILAHAVVFLAGGLLVSVDLKYSTPIGTSLIAAGVAGWVVFVHVLFNEKKEEKIGLLTDFGLQNAFGERGPNIREVYETRLEKADEGIDIMGFGLRTFRQDFGEEFDDWARTLDMRVLLIDPEYPNNDHTYAEQRDREEGDNIGNIENDVRNFIDETSNLIQSEDINFEVQLYQCLPSMTVFRIDDDIFWGPYTVQDQSRNMPIILVAKHGKMYGFLENHFETIWESEELSRSVPREWLE